MNCHPGVRLLTNCIVQLVKAAQTVYPAGGKENIDQWIDLPAGIYRSPRWLEQA
jgi:hypothetical protein